MSIRHYKTILLIVFLIFFLWLVLGYIVPFFVFGNLDDSGKFGDSFGSVNSLFTGMSILGLSITIFMQFKLIEDQRKQSKFDLILKQIDDIKDDINVLGYGDNQGGGVFDHLRKELKLKLSSIKNGIHNPHLISITNINHQFIFLIDSIMKEKEFTDLESNFFKAKISQIFQTYFAEFYKEVIKDEVNEKNAHFVNLKRSTEETISRVELFLQIKFDTHSYEDYVIPFHSSLHRI